AVFVDVLAKAPAARDRQLPLVVQELAGFLFEPVDLAADASPRLRARTPAAAAASRPASGLTGRERLPPQAPELDPDHPPPILDLVVRLQVRERAVVLALPGLRHVSQPLANVRQPVGGPGRRQLLLELAEGARHQLLRLFRRVDAKQVQ